MREACDDEVVISKKAHVEPESGSLQAIRNRREEELGVLPPKNWCKSLNTLSADPLLILNVQQVSISGRNEGNSAGGFLARLPHEGAKAGVA